MITEDSSEMTLSQAFNNNGGNYPASMLMQSLINIERTSQVFITASSFDFNWMAEN